VSIKDRGFASISMKRMREIASLGGKAVHAKGTGNKWTTHTAMLAGRKGGAASAAKRREREHGSSRP
jgi:general stress protein YciG